MVILIIIVDMGSLSRRLVGLEPKTPPQKEGKLLAFTGSGFVFRHSLFDIRYSSFLPRLPNGIKFWLLFHRGETFFYFTGPLFVIPGSEVELSG
jgi:hypothetical protein